jgi:predicted MFS family arabinose efflux permease
LFCAVAPSYELLLAARMITGLFGGVIGSISFAIIADLFPPETRGRVMGVVQTAFSASQILGIPVALFLANRWGWHAPFFLIVTVSVAVGGVIVLRMRPIVGHLLIQRNESPFRHLFTAVSQRDYLNAYACTMLLATGGFMLMPFGSTYIVNNMGISMDQLPIIYMVTGLVSIVAGPFVGRLSDRVGKYAVFCVATLLSMPMVVAFTHLGFSPLWLVIVINVLLMLCVTSRMIAASALTSIVPAAPDRGAFMSVNSSIQQIAGGIASAAAGLIVVRTSAGTLQHYDTLGYVVLGSMAVVMVLLYFLNRAITAKLAISPAERRAA